MYRAKTEWMKKKWFLDTVDNISELESHLWTGPVATGALSFKVAPQLKVPRFSAPRFEESPENAFIQNRTAHIEHRSSKCRAFSGPENASVATCLEPTVYPGNSAAN
jgi:hypothetical protein